VLGRELLLHLADHLCTSYLAGDPDTRKLVDSTRIHLIPSMNPDGWKIATENVRYIIFFVKSKKILYLLEENCVKVGEVLLCFLLLFARKNRKSLLNRNVDVKDRLSLKTPAKITYRYYSRCPGLRTQGSCNSKYL
jgi:hypothetical protein